MLALFSSLRGSLGRMGSFRDECLQREWFQSLLEAQVVIEAWRLHYNTQRPNSSLAYQTPAAFAAEFTIQPAQTLIPVGYKN